MSEIIKYKKSQIAQAKSRLPEKKILKFLKPRKGFPFKEAISKPNLNLIAEIKKASPSEGVIRKDFDFLKIALDYKKAKVSALSVLTEEKYFLGNINHISLIKEKVDLPILRKDFILDRYQIFESLYFGADSILLIAKILSLKEIKEFLKICKDIGLDCVLEINDRKDLEKALKTKTEIIGINNRDLNSFKLNLKTTERLFPLIPKDRIVISESGIKRKSEVNFLKKIGINAILVGEALLKSKNITKKIAELGFYRA